jgi:ubiquinone/menaquinone biosynthesis C-methylase UbiE
MRKSIIDHYEKTWRDFDAWFETHQALYQSELAALKKVVSSGAGLEIGVGTGRFAAPLGVCFGLDPAINMLQLAKKRRIRVVQGVGENLPFKNASFPFVQIVFVLEFVENRLLFLAEAARTLRQNGALILGFIDKDSRWGEYYARNPSHQEFFHPPAVEEILKLFERIGLKFQEAYQTLFQPPPDISVKEEPRSGFGEGGFVVLKARKQR